MIVHIYGREAAPAARLLAALGVAGLLSLRCTWEENANGVSIVVDDPDERQVRAFRTQPKYTVEA